MKALNTQIHDTLVSQHNKGYTSCEHLYTICAHTPSSSHDATLIYAITYAVCANKVCHKLWKASLTYASEWTLRCFLLEPCVWEFIILISLDRLFIFLFYSEHCGRTHNFIIYIDWQQYKYIHTYMYISLSCKRSGWQSAPVLPGTQTTCSCIVGYSCCREGGTGYCVCILWSCLLTYKAVTFPTSTMCHLLPSWLQAIWQSYVSCAKKVSKRDFITTVSNVTNALFGFTRIASESMTVFLINLVIYMLIFTVQYVLILKTVISSFMPHWKGMFVMLT